MSFALSKYNMIYLSGKWRSSAAAEKKMVVLSAEVNKVRGELKLAGQAAQNKQEYYIPPFKHSAPKGKGRKPSTNKSRQKKDEQWRQTQGQER